MFCHLFLPALSELYAFHATLKCGFEWFILLCLQLLKSSSSPALCVTETSLFQHESCARQCHHLSQVLKRPSSCALFHRMKPNNSFNWQHAVNNATLTCSFGGIFQGFHIFWSSNIKGVIFFVRIGSTPARSDKCWVDSLNFDTMLRPPFNSIWCSQPSDALNLHKLSTLFALHRLSNTNQFKSIIYPHVVPGECRHFLASKSNLTLAKHCYCDFVQPLNSIFEWRFSSPLKPSPWAIIVSSGAQYKGSSCRKSQVVAPDVQVQLNVCVDICQVKDKLSKFETWVHMSGG